MKDTHYPIAVLCSDLHLSLAQPSCRADTDWMKTQAGYLQQLKDVADGLPILVAGDIFDRWNAPPELINFALKELPDGMICVPGQHDLPNHLIEQQHRSGYGVLVQAKKIRDISGSQTGNIGGGWTVHGFGWEETIQPPKTKPSLALIHRYIWTRGRSYPGADEKSNVQVVKRDLKGFSVACFGDNHQHFIEVSGKQTVINCGTFIRRKVDEMAYQPSVGLLYADGSVERHRLDTSADKFHEVPEDRKEVPLNMKEFIDRLEGLGEHGLDFRKAVINHLKFEEVDPETKTIILEALEGEDNRA